MHYKYSIENNFIFLNIYMLFYIKHTANHFLSFRKSLVACIMEYISCSKKKKTLAISHFSLRKEMKNILTEQKWGGLSKVVPTLISQGIMFDITYYCRKHNQVSKICKNSHTISNDIINTLIYPCVFPPDLYC